MHFPETDWAQRVIDQLLKFPAGKFDDAVDTCGLFGRFIDKTWKATVPQQQKPVTWDSPMLIKDFSPHKVAA